MKNDQKYPNPSKHVTNPYLTRPNTPRTRFEPVRTRLEPVRTRLEPVSNPSEPEKVPHYLWYHTIMGRRYYLPLGVRAEAALAATEKKVFVLTHVL